MPNCGSIALPALPGALEVLGQGIASSLAPDNLRLRRAIDADAKTLADPRFALLFDPQTAGGLLAAVPAEKAEACVAALRAAGYAAACVIGVVTPRSEAETRIRNVGVARPLAARPRLAADALIKA